MEKATAPGSDRYMCCSSYTDTGRLSSIFLYLIFTAITCNRAHLKLLTLCNPYNDSESQASVSLSKAGILARTIQWQC